MLYLWQMKQGTVWLYSLLVNWHLKVYPLNSSTLNKKKRLAIEGEMTRFITKFYKTVGHSKYIETEYMVLEKKCIILNRQHNPNLCLPCHNGTSQKCCKHTIKQHISKQCWQVGLQCPPVLYPDHWVVSTPLSCAGAWEGGGLEGGEGVSGQRQIGPRRGTGLSQVQSVSCTSQHYMGLLRFPVM